ncbi:signal peptide containing protein [Theileria equi strain WA]|uniref:Signal peptide containing protein n=1 Tax=Theileria equi strain WA TaxID=1537102 RepID=L1LE20_THEEQ|nr:signal peptide containing protein [Theileria equi strain WA]EKX73529.1 signal peptide containing protein [Theileria equi strain WA]|eukprot:XP_004832981.1 signal peptide containing protein [Theileria equi strain WA]
MAIRPVLAFSTLLSLFFLLPSVHSKDVILDISAEPQESITRIYHAARGISYYIYTPNLGYSVVEVRDGQETLWKVARDDHTLMDVVVHIINEKPVLIRIFSTGRPSFNFKYFKARLEGPELLACRRRSEGDCLPYRGTGRRLSADETGECSKHTTGLITRIAHRARRGSITKEKQSDHHERMSPHEEEPESHREKWTSITEEEYYHEYNELEVPKTLDLKEPLDEEVFRKCTWKPFGVNSSIYTPRGKFAIGKITESERVVWESKGHGEKCTSLAVYGEENNPRFFVLFLQRGSTISKLYLEKKAEYIEINEDIFYKKIAKLEWRMVKEPKQQW